MWTDTTQLNFGSGSKIGNLQFAARRRGQTARPIDHRLVLGFGPINGIHSGIEL